MPWYRFYDRFTASLSSAWVYMEARGMLRLPRRFAPRNDVPSSLLAVTSWERHACGNERLPRRFAPRNDVPSSLLAMTSWERHACGNERLPRRFAPRNMPGTSPERNQLTVTLKSVVSGSGSSSSQERTYFRDMVVSPAAVVLKVHSSVPPAPSLFSPPGSRM